MIENLRKLQKLATENAHNHRWVIQWNINNSPPQEILSAIPVQCRTLSIGDALALCHSELSEALDAYRNDDKENFAEELADEIIRILHLAGDLQIDLTEEVNKKMEKNKLRPINHGRVNL